MKKLPAVIIILFCAMGPVFVGAQQSGKGLDINTLMGDVSGAFSQMQDAYSSIADEMTLEDDYYLGRAVAAEIIKAYKLYTADPALTRYLNRICLAIVLNSAKPVLFSGYQVEILDTNEICAFASPGGHIFLSRGLISAAQSEDALAVVIAHEIAHIQYRHVAEILANERTVQELNNASNRAASIAARSLTVQERSKLFRESLSVSINTLFRSGYSRQQEFDADKMAQLLLISAGYDPAALVEVLQILEKASQDGNMSKTHPSPAMRISNLGSIKGGTGRDTLPVRKPRFNSALKR